MAVTNQQGIFSLEDVRIRQNTGYWPTTPTSLSPYGYFGGGATPGFVYISTVDRIDYTNDTATASPKGPLSLIRNDSAATGNSSYGYFGGGQAPSGIQSTVDRIDYSNDTATASVRGPLSVGRYQLAASSSEANGASLPANNPMQVRPFAYFGGGDSPTSVSTVDRIDYSNDTATASVKGPLSVARTALAATGNSSYGYFGGGSIFPTQISTVDRIDYSNDTATASPKGPLSVARYLLAATGNSSFGYFGGGYPTFSTVDRIDYSNDTATASPKGPLSLARYYLAAASAAANGLPQ